MTVANHDVQFEVLPKTPITEASATPYKRILNNDGSVWSEFRSQENIYHIRFPKFADFIFDTVTSSVRCHAPTGTTSDEIEHLYLNHVLPLIKNAQGSLVLHSSGVKIGDEAVLFVGTSGSGKSTIATYFATKGHALISDDNVELVEDGNSLTVQPGHPSLRLRADSLDAIVPSRGPDSGEVTFLNKSRVSNLPDIDFLAEPTKLAAVFHLDENKRGSVIVEEMHGRDIFLASLQHMFVLDGRSTQAATKTFEHVAQLANAAVHMRLSYPRDYSMLPDVYNAVVERLHTTQVDHE